MAGTHKITQSSWPPGQKSNPNILEYEGLFLIPTFCITFYKEYKVQWAPEFFRTGGKLNKIQKFVTMVDSYNY
jgi:hypothetical protein